MTSHSTTFRYGGSTFSAALPYGFQCYTRHKSHCSRYVATGRQSRGPTCWYRFDVSAKSLGRNDRRRVSARDRSSGELRFTPLSGLQAHAQSLSASLLQLTAKEQAKLESLGTDKARLQHALALWTLKEAYVKATGEGLHRDLSQLEFDLDLSEIKNGVAGSSSLEGDSLDKWSFDLVWLQEAEEEYLVAVAGNEAVGGKGEVRFWRTQPDWLKFVEFGEIVDRLCNGDTS